MWAAGKKSLWRSQHKAGRRPVGRVPELAGKMNKTDKQPRERPRSYRSRVDGLLALPLFVVPAALLVALGAGSPAVPSALRLTVLLPVVGVWGFALWVFLGTSYRIDANTLTVRSGPLCWVIALSEIESVTPTREARSGPALSLDRLRILYGGGRKMLISPRDKERFLRDLDRSRAQALGAGSRA